MMLYLEAANRINRQLILIQLKLLLLMFLLYTPDLTNTNKKSLKNWKKIL